MRRADGLIPKDTPIDLVKMDVEGYELHAFRGLMALVGSRPVIICEFHTDALRRQGPETPVELLAEFAKQGYMVYEAGGYARFEDSPFHTMAPAPGSRTWSVSPVSRSSPVRFDSTDDRAVPRPPDRNPACRLKAWPHKTFAGRDASWLVMLSRWAKIGISVRSRKFIGDRTMSERLSALFERRDFMKELVRQQLRQRYQSSVLGFLWTLLNPLLVYVSFCIIFSYINHSNLKDYGIYFFSGYMAWTFFANTISSGADSIVANAGYVTRVHVPKAVFPLASVAVNLVDLAASFIILVALMLILGAKFSPALLTLPISAVLLAVFSTGAALLTARWTVLLRDFRQLLNSILFIWFFFCPILYRSSVIPQHVRLYFNLNPMLPYLHLFQAPISGASVPAASDFLSALLLATGTIVMRLFPVLPVGKPLLLLRLGQLMQSATENHVQPHDKTKSAVQLTDVSVKYQLLTEEARTLKGRLISAMSKEKCAEFWALQGVSLSVESGEVLGIIGPNGSGKSTMLRVISRIIEPTEGHVSTVGRLTPILDLTGTLNPEYTGRENAFMFGALHGIPRDQIAEWIPRIVEFTSLGPFIDVPLKAYSSGMVARLAFALSTQLEPDILLLDEVLSVGDEQFQRKSYFRVRNLIENGNVVLIVSHNIALLEQICTRMVLVWGGKIVAEGAPAQVVAEYRKKIR